MRVIRVTPKDVSRTMYVPADKIIAITSDDYGCHITLSNGAIHVTQRASVVLEMLHATVVKPKD